MHKQLQRYILDRDRERESREIFA